MAQKQKLKSERGSLNVGIKDMFMTMDPPTFLHATYELAELRDNDKPNFNRVLEKFEEHKNKNPRTNSVMDVIKRGLIRNDDNLNELLSVLLFSYWVCKKNYKGGYFWRMMPRKKANENEAQFDIRRKRIEDNLMQVMLDVLDDCNYYIH